MKPNVFVLLSLFISSAVLAEPGPAMTKIQYRDISPQITEGSFAAKPKTLYIAGDTYTRNEEQPDPQLGIHGLIVVSEPDIWMVNLLTKTAQHIVDPGPTFVVHNNIMGPGAPKEFASLEFGKEIDFFKKNNANVIEVRQSYCPKCDAMELKLAGYHLYLFTQPDTKKPFQLNIIKDEKVAFSLRYMIYETNLPFDASLFKPPVDVKITEAKQ